MITNRTLGINATKCCLLSFIFLLTSLFGVGQSKNKTTTGAEQIDQLMPLLQNKAVALMVNQTSVSGYTAPLKSYYKKDSCRGAWLPRQS